MIIKKNINKKYPNRYSDTKNLNSVIGSVCEDILESEITDAYPGSNTMMILDKIILFTTIQI